MYNIKVHFKKKMLVISFMCALCLSACGADDNLEAEAQIIVEAVENKDIKTVEQIILGTDEFMVDEELEDFFQDSEEGNNGIITKIIEQDAIEVKKITEEYILYEITAPDLSNMFQDVMKEENLTADSFEEYIYHYIVTTDKTQIEIEVPYTYENEEFTADYSTQEFVNGITGNLITAYQELIQQMVQEHNGEDVK